MNQIKKHSGLPIAWVALIAFDAAVIAIACAQDEPNVAATKSVVTQIDGPATTSPGEVRFEAIDVFIDSQKASLAAWQVEIVAKTDGVEIVGIEGGDHAAFSDPPYYDPKAMNNDRVIIAAFSTSEDLPTGRSRIARIHVQLEGHGLKEYESILNVSADTNGDNIPAQIELARAGA